MENYEIIRTIGKGTFGKVVLGNHKLTNEKVAIKIINKSLITSNNEQLIHFHREINFLKNLHHQNIITLFEIIETQSSCNIVMEYSKDGDLFTYIVLNKQLKEPVAIRLYLQLLEALSYIHQEHISHRDLKPENILLTHNYKVLKLTDFGLSNHYNFGELLKTPCGSPCYAAPEMIIGKEYNGIISDVWSSGVILYVMICGYLPFKGENNTQIYENIIKGNYFLPDYLSIGCKNLLEKILVIDPSKRITLEGIKNHPYLQEYYEKFKLEHNNHQKYNNEIDEKILEKMENEYNFKDKNEIIKNLKTNQFNQITTTYKLLQLKVEHENINNENNEKQNLYIDKKLMNNKGNSVSCQKRIGLIGIRKDGFKKRNDKLIKTSNSTFKTQYSTNLKIRNFLNTASSSPEKKTSFIIRDKNPNNGFQKNNNIKSTNLQNHLRNSVSGHHNKSRTSNDISENNMYYSVINKSSNKIDYSYTKSDSTKGSPIKNKNKVYVPSQTISLLDNNYQNNVKSNSLSKNDSKKKSQNVLKKEHLISTFVSKDPHSLTIESATSVNHKRSISNVFESSILNTPNIQTERREESYPHTYKKVFSQFSQNSTNHSKIKTEISKKTNKDKNNFRHFSKITPLSAKINKTTKYQQSCGNIGKKENNKLCFSKIYKYDSPTKSTRISTINEPNFFIFSTKLKSEEMFLKIQKIFEPNKTVNCEKKNWDLFLCKDTQRNELSIELEKSGNSTTVVKITHKNGNESITKEMIKLIIFNIGF